MAQESKNENRKQRIREAFHDGKQVERMPAREDMAPQHSDDVIYRVAPYCRVSTMSEMQAESFEIQQQYYNEYIAKHQNQTKLARRWSYPLPRLSYLTHCQLLALVVLGNNLFNQLAVMAHDVIKGVFEGEEETGLCMELLCVPALGDEIDMLQPNGPQTHVDTPLAGHGLQREIPHVIFEGQTVLRTELNQGVRSLAVSLLIGDRN